MRLRSVFCLRTFAILFLMAACVPSLAAQPSVAGTVTCDRACLEGMVDKYLNAMVAHDPSRAPLSPNCQIRAGQRTTQDRDGAVDNRHRSRHVPALFRRPGTR